MSSFTSGETGTSTYRSNLSPLSLHAPTIQSLGPILAHWTKEASYINGDETAFWRSLGTIALLDHEQRHCQKNMPITNFYDIMEKEEVNYDTRFYDKGTHYECVLVGEPQELPVTSLR